VSLESGKPEVFVRPFPEVDKGKCQISRDGGLGPLWAPDSRRLYYRNEDAVMTVGIEPAPSFTPEKPEILFRANYYYYRAGGASQPSWDIHPDGRRFLMIKEKGTAGGESATGATAAAVPGKISIVLNWTDELKQRVPVK